MNLSEIFPREAPASIELEDGEVWGPVVIEDPRVDIPSLGSRLSLEDSQARWIGTDDMGHGFVYTGKPREEDNKIILTHADNEFEIVIRPLNEGDSQYFGKGKTEMSMDEIYEAADAMFVSEIEV